MSDAKIVKEVFDQWAVSGRTDDSAAGHVFSGMQIIQEIDKQNFDFLDIGCGNGWICREIAQISECKNVTGLDISSKMVEVCKKRQKTDKEHYVCSDFLEWNMAKKFDIIFSFEAIYYFNEIENGLEKIHNMLNNGGNVLIGMDCYHENVESHTWPKFVGLDMKILTINDWEVLLKNAGFKNIKAVQIKNANAKDEWKRTIGTLYLNGEKTEH